MEYHGIVVDSHMHFAWPIERREVKDAMRQTGADRVCLCVFAHFSRLAPNPDALCCKLLMPDNTYVFGCLDQSAYLLHPKSFGRYMVRHVKRLLAMGCDGVKMIEGKPQFRRELHVPDFDLPVWEPYFAYMEKAGVPILWHVNDPEAFWNPEKMPAFAKAQGWGYGPDDVNNEEQYRQILAVLKKHPRLRITFAHMFFLSAQLPRLTDILAAYENVRVDLTPGIELYDNLSATPEAAAAFFTRFSDRILYGTDIGGRAVLKDDATKFNQNESLRRVAICKTYLTASREETISSDGDFLIHNPAFVLRPLDLDEAALEKIFYKNFFAFAGDAPRRVRRSAVRRECLRLKRCAAKLKARGITNFCDTRGTEDALHFIKEESL